MIPIFVALAVAVAVATVYFAVRSRDFRKFLSGAFFVSGGVQFYLYLADVPVPLLGTDFVQTPAISGVRSVAHFVLFLVTLYFGFIRKPRASAN